MRGGLVKEKFEDKTDSVPSIITVMEKITNRGKVDDWLFYMIRLSDRSFVREQPAASCVGCHSKYVKTDFVSSTTFSLLTAHAKKSLEKD